MTEQLSVLLSSCENDTPPFDDLIRSTLSALKNQSRFHFALELQHTLDSNKDSLSPIQRLCILCTVNDIGNGMLPTKTKTPIDTNTNNAFRDFLEKYRNDAQNIIDDIQYKGNLPLLHHLPFRTKEELGQSENRDSSQPYRAEVIASDLDFYRPLPPFVTNNIVKEKKNLELDLNLQFLHTTYPSLRYQWLPRTDVDHAGDITDGNISGISNTDTSKLTIQTLLQKIFEAPLEVDEEQSLLTYCNSTGIGVSSRDDTPPLLTLDNLHMLVEHNPNIAIELLMQTQNENQATSYHSKLVNMEITIHTMEVVYRLATAGAAGGISPKVSYTLNTEYLHIFILGLFERCATSQDRKMVRLVSVFLQNLIQNGIVNVDDFVSAEVQAFCIENSRVREAQGLFKLLKEKSGSVNSGVSYIAATSDDGRIAHGEGGTRGKNK